MLQATVSAEWHIPTGWMYPLGMLKGTSGMPKGTWREGIDDVAERLRITREALGLTQAEICRRTGISTNAWNNNERGANMMSLPQAKKLRAIGASLDWIYFGDLDSVSHDLATKIQQQLSRKRRA